MNKENSIKKKMIILGWDGATFTVLDKMVNKGIMPNLKRVMENGARSELLSTIPPITGPSWSSFRTGKKPENHGLFSFIKPPESSLDIKYIERHTAKSIDGSSYWNFLNSFGKKCIIIDMPLSDPVEELDGVMISGMMTRGKRGALISPEYLRSELEKEFENYFNKSLTDGLDVSLSYLDHLIKSLAEKGEMDIYLLKTCEWDVLTTVYSSVDTLQHYFWKFLDKKSVQYKNNRNFQEKIDEFFKKLDLTLGRYLDILGKNGNLIIVSDHGFGPNNYTFYVNNFLKKNKYFFLEKKKTTLVLNKELIKRILLKIDIFSFRKYVKKEIREQINRSFENELKINWTKTKAYFRSNNEYGIYLNLKGKYFEGSLEEDDYSRVLSNLIDGLKSIKNDFTGEYVFDNVLSKSEVYNGGKYIKDAPDIVLIPNRGLNLRGFKHSNQDVCLEKNRSLISGFHEKEGIFLGFGPDFKKNYEFSESFFIYDIAPMIMYIFDLPADKYMDGKIAKKLLTLRIKINSKKKKSYNIEKKYIGDSDFNDNKSMEQLRGLGYID